MMKLKLGMWKLVENLEFSLKTHELQTKRLNRPYHNAQYYCPTRKTSINR